MKKNLLIFGFLVGNIFFALLYFDLKQKVTLNTTSTIKSEIPSDEYPFLSKRIFTERQNDILINFIPLRTAMREYIGKQNDKIGVYFEYLPSGASIAINDQLEVRLASLIKLPIVMAVYKQIEKGILTKSQILPIQEKDINRSFGDLWKMGPGAEITVDEAIHLTLAESDNTASNVLVSALPGGKIDEVFDYLDIPVSTGDFPVISPENYSSILRSLYLSSYLTKENSNEIIAILTKTQFHDKLPAGVPKDIKVAHKIGVFVAEGVFSDCGIVYVPQRPYLICIMTKANEENSQKHMEHISKMVYDYITLVKGGE